MSKRITVLVTDSGLGGLSVCANIAHRAKALSFSKELRLIFCNALPHTNYGYNRMKSMNERAEVFSSALSWMVHWFKPDLILVASHTLSSVYPHTDFAKSARMPVFSMIDVAVDMIYTRMKIEPDSTVIMFATETTIAEGAHESRLRLKGIESRRIVTQPCPNLESEIQKNPTSHKVNALIERYSSEAIENLQTETRTLLAALCCTHYSFSGDIFTKTLTRLGKCNVELIDPNKGSAELPFHSEMTNQRETSKVSVHVFSRVSIPTIEISKISDLLEQVSPETSWGLMNYTLKRDLFPFRDRTFLTRLHRELSRFF